MSSRQPGDAQEDVRKSWAALVISHMDPWMLHSCMRFTCRFASHPGGDQVDGLPQAPSDIGSLPKRNYVWGASLIAMCSRFFYLFLLPRQEHVALTVSFHIL